MQTTPITTSTPNGQARTADGAGGKPGAGTGTIFAGLIQALAGGTKATPVPTAGAGGQADATEGEGEAQPDEGGADAEVVATAQLQGVELPPPLPTQAAAPVEAATPATPGAVAPTAEGGIPAPPAAGTPSAASPASAQEDAAPPALAQAIELAKVLGAGTRIRVTHAAEAPAPAPVQNLAAVAVAAALGEAPVTAVAEPKVRAASPEPKKAPVVAAGFSLPIDGEHGATTSGRPAAMPPTRQTAVGADAEADQGAAPRAAIGSAVSSSPTAAAPGAAADGNPDAASAEPAPVAFGREAQAAPSHSPAPAATVPERAQAPAFAAAPPPANQVSVHFAKAVRAGVDRIAIQLAPASLGRVEISLDLSDTQQVRASIVVETNEALELLRADTRVLERALQDAGLKTDPGSLSFQLRDHGARAGQDGGTRQGFAGHPGNGRAADDPAASAAAEASARQAARPAPAASGRIDIQA